VPFQTAGRHFHGRGAPPQGPGSRFRAARPRTSRGRRAGLRPNRSYP
jgi:hypothetical protein